MHVHKSRVLHEVKMNKVMLAVTVGTESSLWKDNIEDLHLCLEDEQKFYGSETIWG